MALRGVSIGALSSPEGSSQVRCAPVILPSRSVTARDHRRPGLGRADSPASGTIVAAGMKAEASGFGQIGNAAITQIRFCDCARNRLRHSEEPPRRIPAILLALAPIDASASRSGSSRGKRRKRRASSATSWKLTRPQLSRMTSRRSPCSPVAASVLCATEHKTEYVAPRVMLRICDWVLSRGD